LSRGLVSGQCRKSSSFAVFAFISGSRLLCVVHARLYAGSSRQLCVVCVWSDRPCIQLQLASSLPLLNKAEISVIYINVKIITFFRILCNSLFFLGIRGLHMQNLVAITLAFYNMKQTHRDISSALWVD